MVDVTCDKSPDGRHEFDFYETVWDDMDGGAMVALAECKHCPLEIGPLQMSFWLNAAVRLNAEEAEMLLRDYRTLERELLGLAGITVARSLEDTAPQADRYVRWWRGEANEHS